MTAFCSSCSSASGSNLWFCTANIITIIAVPWMMYQSVDDVSLSEVNPLESTLNFAKEPSEDTSDSAILYAHVSVFSISVQVLYVLRSHNRGNRYQTSAGRLLSLKDNVTRTHAAWSAMTSCFPRLAKGRLGENRFFKYSCIKNNIHILRMCKQICEELKTTEKFNKAAS